MPLRGHSPPARQRRSPPLPTKPQSPVTVHQSPARAPARTVEFWSSVEYGTFLRGLVRELGALGWEARQRFAVSEFAYREARSATARWRMRWQSYVTYPRLLRRRLRREAAPAVLVVCTNTFYAPAVALRAARARGVPVVHWVFDLFPEVLTQAGKLRAGGWLDRKLGGLTRRTFAAAAANVFLGATLAAEAIRAHGAVLRSTVIPVGADALPFAGDAPQARPAGIPVRVLYCGNFGRMHDADTVVGLVQSGVPAGCRLEFRGNGAGFRALAEVVAARVETSAVQLGSSLPEGAWVETMRAADIGLVTMLPGAERLVMPSKTYSAMAAGQAILAVCPSSSDLADTVRRHDAGWVVEPGDVPALAAVLERAATHPDEVLAKRRNAFRAGQQDFSQATIARQWDGLLRGVVAGSESSVSVAPSDRITV